MYTLLPEPLLEFPIGFAWTEEGNKEMFLGSLVEAACGRETT